MTVGRPWTAEAYLQSAGFPHLASGNRKSPGFCAEGNPAYSRASFKAGGRGELSGEVAAGWEQGGKCWRLMLLSLLSGTYSLKCHECTEINTFNCPTVKVCQYEVRRCMILSIRKYLSVSHPPCDLVILREQVQSVFSAPSTMALGPLCPHPGSTSQALGSAPGEGHVHRLGERHHLQGRAAVSACPEMSPGVGDSCTSRSPSPVRPCSCVLTLLGNLGESSGPI